MLDVTLRMKYTDEPLKRTPVELRLDTAPDRPLLGATDRTGVAHFDIEPVSGRIMVGGATRYHGRLAGEITISLMSLTEAATVNESGAPGGSKGGSTAYPSMQIRKLVVGDREVETDSEGYLVNLDDWSEDFVRAEAEYEGLVLTDAHWEVIRYLRDYYERHHVQAQVREIIRHFTREWGRETGSSKALHKLFSRGGPQKQGNRLAGLLRVKGEH
ncbi:MAG: TusE/DsrC/DsvC family sulfur relay protein [Proteobacteria bacterium]|nr:MAG: TusE/DsrC/DsvC family sulfur relay protein [Pseudomonadota bacterium]